MSLRILVENCTRLKLISEAANRLLVPLAAVNNEQSVRHRQTKHWNPKWKKLRGLKVYKMDLPKYNEDLDNLSEEEMRSKYKEKGLLPPRPWIEKQIFISTTGGVFEAYVPPEGDGKVSPISAQGAKQTLQFLEKKTKTMMSIRKIRTYDEDFDVKEFCKNMEAIYLKSHECLMNKDTRGIREFVTERAYPEILHNVRDKTIRWKWICNVELPRVVHARTTHIVTNENIFAQVTVRFHTQQQLAIYDRFGRLMHGSEILSKDVLEYVVFEKHIANEYGKWRIHDKIIPDWLPPREPGISTYLQKEDIIAKVESDTKEVAVKEEKETTAVANNVATASN